MVGVAIINDVLRGAIRYRFVEMAANEEEELFGADRPLHAQNSEALRKPRDLCATAIPLRA